MIHRTGDQKPVPADAETYQVGAVVAVGVGEKLVGGAHAVAEGAGTGLVIVASESVDAAEGQQL